MKNRTLAISRGCIPYIKELRNIAGSVTASILMQQLDYWFDKTNGDPFYKFKAPCENEYYKNGDSFTEELGFSIEEFTNAFAKIGFSYKSKTEFENATNKFQAMFFCSYFDRKEGLTFYFRNHELLDTKLNQLFTVNGESRFIETGKVDLHKMAKSVSPIYITEDYNRRLQQKIDTASGFSQNENPISRKNGKIEIKTSEYGRTQILCPCGEELLDETLEPDKYFCSECLSMYSKDEVLKIIGVNENSVVNDSFTAQNPTVKESLTVQKQKKEEEFEQFWLQWKDLCKNKGSQTGGKKPAKIEYEKVLKKVKQEDIIRVLNAFNNYIQIAFANNKNCERWIKSENWDNIDEAVADYKQQEENIKKQLIKEGKPVPLPQKTPLEAQKEIIDTNALLELRNAKYNALTQKQRDTSDGIRNHLLTYFGEVHHEWIKSSIWFQQNLENDEINLHIRIFSEAKRKVIELNVEKIRDSLTNFKCNAVNEVIIKVVKN